MREEGTKRGDLQRTAVVAAPPAPTTQPTVASKETKKTVEGPIIMNGQVRCTTATCCVDLLCHCPIAIHHGNFFALHWPLHSKASWLHASVVSSHPTPATLPSSRLQSN